MIASGRNTRQAWSSRGAGVTKGGKTVEVLLLCLGMLLVLRLRMLAPIVLVVVLLKGKIGSHAKK
jgi:hypothetical protein